MNMKKARFVLRYILPVFRGRIFMLWIFILYSSFLFTYFFTIWQSQQAFLTYAPDAENMRNYLVVGTDSDSDLTTEDFLSRNQAIAEAEGVEGLAGVYDIFCEQNGFSAVAYPSDLLNQMELRDENHQLIQMDVEKTDAYPVWVDIRLKSKLPIGTPLTFVFWNINSDEMIQAPGSYDVAGYLNREHVSLNWGGLSSTYPSLGDVMTTGYNGMAMLTVSDAFEGDPAYSACMPPVLLVKTKGDAAQWSATVNQSLQRKGIGSCFAYSELVYNTKHNTQPFLSGTAGNLCYLLPMSLLAMFGMQQLLISRLRHTQAVLSLCGMSQRVWIGAWMMATAFMTVLPSVLGYFLFVILQRFDLMYPLAGAVAPSLWWLAVIALIQYVVGLVGLFPSLMAQKENVVVMNEDGGAL